MGEFIIETKKGGLPLERDFQVPFRCLKSDWMRLGCEMQMVA